MSDKAPPQPLPSFGGPVDILALLGGGASEACRDEGLELALLTHWQAGLPLDPQPFQRIGEAHDRDGRQVRAALRRLIRQGVLERVGAVLTPAAFGASTLAALCVPSAQRDAIAGYASLMPEVSAVFACEHAYNLWFVLTAHERAPIDRALTRLREATDCSPLDLPMEAGFFADTLGALPPAPAAVSTPVDIGRAHLLPDSREWRLLGAVQAGLPLVPRPFARLGMRAGMDEHEVVETLAHWQSVGALRRLGLVLRQYDPVPVVSALCVWDVPAALALEKGRRMAAAGVRLCFQRARVPGRWPYNLYCVLHGRCREAVLRTREQLVAEVGLGAFPSEVLLTSRRYKQHSALFGAHL